MSEQTLKSAVLLVADVTASVELYERLGDTEAFGTIAAMLDRLRDIAERAGGQFVQSRGDDVLSVFSDADAAAAASAAMREAAGESVVTLHIAMHAGEAILARESIFGDTVNVTYRLASIANANEALATSTAVETMSPVWQRKYRPLREFLFKGKAAPIDVLAYQDHGAVPLTQLPEHLRPAEADARIVLRIAYGSIAWELHEAESLTVGRAEGVDLLIPQPWISRSHAMLYVRDGLAQLTDRSSFGSFLTPNGALEMRVRRSSVPLAGTGVIALGTSREQARAEWLDYEVIAVPG